MSHDLTGILTRIDQGDREAVDELLPQVYSELQQMARVQMNHERDGHTLQPTALVNEAYLRLVNPKSPLPWKSRGHFFAAAAEAMRRILVEHARRKLSKKRGGDYHHVDLPKFLPDYRLSPQQLMEFSDAIDRLAELDPVKADLVKLRCFAGLDREALSNALSVSLITVDRYWAFAKVWLYRELNGSESEMTGKESNDDTNGRSRY